MTTTTGSTTSKTIESGSATAMSKAMPGLDFDAIVSMHRANLETFVAAQRIMFDFAQTLTRRQAEIMKDSLGRADAMIKGFDAKKQPHAYMDDAKANFEKAMTEVKETMDLGIKAQNEVVDLFVKRATSSLEEAKKVAA